MRTQHLAPTLAFGLLLAASTAGAQPSPASPVVTPRLEVEPPALRVADPTRDAAEAAATERLLAGLDADARERRVLSLAVGVGGGAVLTGLGTWLLVRRDDERLEGDLAAAAILGGGVGLLLGGGLVAILPSYEQKLRDAWEETRGAPVAARRARFGAALDEYARVARAGRRRVGWTLLGGGVAVVAGAAVLSAIDDSRAVSVGSGTTAIALGGVLMMALSIPMLGQPSPVEYAQRFWNAGEARPAVRLAGASVLPLRGGALAALTLEL